MPAPQVYTEAEQKAAETARAAAKPKGSLKDVAKAAIDTQWVGFAAARQFARKDTKDDPSFVMTDGILKEATNGLQNPEDYYSEFRDAKSVDEVRLKRAEIDSALERQDKLMSLGALPGGAAALVAAALDPVSIGASVLTEGAAAPFIYGAKATRVQRALRAGLVASAANAPLEGYMASQDPLYKAEDAVTGVAIAGLTAGLVKYKWPGKLQADMEAVATRGIHEAQVEELRTAGVKPTEKTSTMLPDALNPDGSFKTPADHNSAWFAQAERNGSFTFSPKTRIDRAADVFSSESEKVRMLGHSLFDDPASVKGSFQGESAEAFMNMQHNAALRRFTLNMYHHFDEFVEEQAKLGKKVTFDEFDELVTKATRAGSHESPAVQKMVAIARKDMDQIAEKAKNPGRGVPVKGADGMDVHNYVPRRWSSAKIAALLSEPGGGATVSARIASAIRGVEPDIAAQLADRIIDISQRSRRSSLDFSFLGKPKEDVANLLKREHGIADGEANKIADALERLTQGKDAGLTSNLKTRININEAEIDDLLENSMMSLFSSYSRSMHGWIGLARQGIDSEASFKRLLGEAVDEKAAQGHYTGADHLLLKRSKNARELKNLEDGFNYIIGRAVGEDPSRLSASVGRVLRKTNYARMMNMMGISVLFEGMKTLSQAGLMATIKQVPELMHLWRGVKNGKFIDELTEETAQLTGWLNEPTVRSAHSRLEEFGAGGEVKTSFFSKTEHGLEKLGNVTSKVSLADWADGLTRRFAGKAMIQTFLDSARTGKAHTLGKARLAEIGVDDALMASIKREMMKPGGASWDAAGRIKKLNIDQWDHETRIRFGVALRRWGGYIIQENNFGSLPGWASTTGGKLVAQFRSFSVAAWAKQTHHMVKYHDFRSFMDFTTTTMAGYLSYLAYVQASSVGRKDAQEYRERMLTDEKVYAQAFARGAAASILPGVIDTGLDAAGFKGVFDNRNSGLSSNILTGNPTYDLAVNKLYGAMKGAIRSSKKGEVDDETARNFFSLLPFQNMFGLKSLINNIVSDLPHNRDR